MRILGIRAFETPFTYPALQPGRDLIVGRYPFKFSLFCLALEIDTEHFVVAARDIGARPTLHKRSSPSLGGLFRVRRKTPTVAEDQRQTGTNYLHDKATSPRRNLDNAITGENSQAINCL